MRYALECPVEGKVKVPERARRIKWYGKDLTFGCDESGTLRTIRVEGPVSPDEIISHVFTHGSDSKITGMVASGGKRIHKELLQDLQALESTFGYYLNLSRIRREFITGIVLPETPEEKRGIEWNNMRIVPELPDADSAPTVDEFKAILRIAHHCRPLSAVMAYFREGEMDMKAMRYITAFFSFYFVLEGLYGKGKTKNAAVEAEFRRSKVLTGCVGRLHGQKGWPKPRLGHMYSMPELLKGRNKKPTVENIIEQLVWLRGDLHHFVNNPQKPSGTPLTHEHYEPLALYMEELCRMVLLEEIKARLCP